MRARRIRVEHSPAVLIGRLFDERGNRMTPTHSNKDGVRYRYYVSHALLQRRNEDAGGVARVPAMALEKLVVEAVRARTQPGATLHSGFSDREVVDAYVERIVVRPNAIDIELREQATDGGAPSLATDVPVGDGQATSSTPPSSPCLGAHPRSFPSKEFYTNPRPRRRSSRRPGTQFFSPLPRHAPGSMTSLPVAFNHSPNSLSRKEKLKDTFACLSPSRSRRRKHWPRSSPDPVQPTSP
jgi:hypothetical protein